MSAERMDDEEFSELLNAARQRGRYHQPLGVEASRARAAEAALRAERDAAVARAERAEAELVRQARLHSGADPSALNQALAANAELRKALHTIRVRLMKVENVLGEDSGFERNSEPHEWLREAWDATDVLLARAPKTGGET